MSKTVRRKKTKEKGFVIGILSMPHAPGKSHIMRSYVDWLAGEGEGVVVVPVPYDTEEVELYYQVLHGLVIPGGDTEYVMRQEPMMARTVERFLELAMRPGEHFPVWAVCLGYEMVMSVIGGLRGLERIEDQVRRRLTWTTEGMRSGLYRGLGRAAQEETVQNHLFGISPKTFQENGRLRRLFRCYATATTGKGEEYVAIVQSKKWPVFGVMFHPERQSNRRAFARVFLAEVRKCPHPRGIIKGFSWGKTGACRQYPELAGEPCYFFSG
jgi:gamma-glutamyl hydrolase